VIATQFEKMAEMGVTIAVMACNTAYASPIFDTALEMLRAKQVKLQILHLIDETINHIKSRYPQVRRVGLLATQGTYKTRLYDQALEAADLEVVIPDEQVRVNDIHAALYGPSFGIKTCDGPVTVQAMDRVRSAIDHVIQRGAEAVILGCTELPLAVKEDQIDGIPILDPAKIMAEKLVMEISPAKLVQSS
jgi:aspartate racemase